MTSVTITGQTFTIDYANGAGSTNVALVRAPTAWIWDGGGANDNWTTAANWTANAGSPGAGDIVHFAGSTRTTPNNNNTAGLQIGEIFFDAGAGSFTLGGMGVTLASGIVNNANSAEIVNMPIALGGDQTFNAAAGKLTFGTSATIDGSHILTLSGPDGEALL